MVQIEGTYYTGGHFKVPQHLADIPRLADPDDPRNRFHGNHALRFITEGNKHFSCGCEAYGFENGGYVEKCLLARGFISQYHQPEREVINANGKKRVISCPPMVAILKSASPDYYVKKGLDADWPGKVEVIGSKLLIHRDFASATSFHWVAGSTNFQITFPHVTMDNDKGVVGYWMSGEAIRGKDIARYGLVKREFNKLARAGFNTLYLVRPGHSPQFFLCNQAYHCQKSTACALCLGRLSRRICCLR